jgi:hypothetical protein
MQNLPHLSRQWFGSKMRAPLVKWLGWRACRSKTTLARFESQYFQTAGTSIQFHNVTRLRLLPWQNDQTRYWHFRRA